MPLVYSLLADAVFVAHLGFILFVVFGGLLVRARRAWLWIHIPALVWAALLELYGWTCPLTPVENALRRAAGGAGYATGFISHYIHPVIYPMGLTREIQLALGVGVVAVNTAIYTWVAVRLHRRRR